MDDFTSKVGTPALGGTPRGNFRFYRAKGLRPNTGLAEGY